ncbi:hypothetical protein ES703_64005 [subsurface metagenome]
MIIPIQLGPNILIPASFEICTIFFSNLINSGMPVSLNPADIITAPLTSPRIDASIIIPYTSLAGTPITNKSSLSSISDID